MCEVTNQLMAMLHTGSKINVYETAIEQAFSSTLWKSSAAPRYLVRSFPIHSTVFSLASLGKRTIASPAYQVVSELPDSSENTLTLKVCDNNSYSTKYRSVAHLRGHTCTRQRESITLPPSPKPSHALRMNIAQLTSMR